MKKKHTTRLTSGINQLDGLLGGLFIGDNVVWYDSAGSLAHVFCMNFIRASFEENKPLIYVSFDHSPNILTEKLGEFVENPLLTIMDCFTFGKGGGSDVFAGFYKKKHKRKLPCRFIRIDSPSDGAQVMETLYEIHSEMGDVDVRFVFDSLTGMAELWDGEDHILKFYSRSCPRLYALNTIAYWIIEKDAHSKRIKAHINKIAQVAMDLSLSRGKTSLTILKADNRNLDNLNKSFNYWAKDMDIGFDIDRRTTSRIDLGRRLKNLRIKRGMSQTELAKSVGVTPSNISQVESNLIYPSLPALLKIAEILHADVGSFFQDSGPENRFVFPASEATDSQFSDLPRGSVSARILIPPDLDPKFEPYLIEIPPGKIVPSHFFIQKGEELGYLLSGELEMKIEKTTYTANAGDVVYLSSQMPTRWKNSGTDTARLFWIKERV